MTLGRKQLLRTISPGVAPGKGGRPLSGPGRLGSAPQGGRGPEGRSLAAVAFPLRQLEGAEPAAGPQVPASSSRDAPRSGADRRRQQTPCHARPGWRQLLGPLRNTSGTGWGGGGEADCRPKPGSVSVRPVRAPWK